MNDSADYWSTEYHNLKYEVKELRGHLRAIMNFIMKNDDN